MTILASVGGTWTFIPKYFLYTASSHSMYGMVNLKKKMPVMEFNLITSLLLLLSHGWLLRDTMDCSPPGPSLHGILQARILERVAISLSRGSSWPKDWTRVSALQADFFTSGLTKTLLAPILGIWFKSSGVGKAWKLAVLLGFQVMMVLLV